MEYLAKKCQAYVSIHYQDDVNLNEMLKEIVNEASIHNELFNKIAMLDTCNKFCEKCNSTICHCIIEVNLDFLPVEQCECTICDNSWCICKKCS